MPECCKFVLLDISAFIMAAFTIVSSIYHLKSKHPSYVQAANFCFSLGLVLSFMAFTLFYIVGGIDNLGNYQGKNGERFFNFLNFFLDFNSEFAIIIGLLLLLVLPQLITYVLSGLSGCASNIIFLRGGSIIAFWTLIKSFATASGILIGLVAAINYYGLQGVDFFTLSRMFIFSQMLALTAFAFLWLYAEYSELLARLPRPKWFIDITLSIHGWATRNRHTFIEAMTPHLLANVLLRIYAMGGMPREAPVVVRLPDGSLRRIHRVRPVLLVTGGKEASPDDLTSPKTHAISLELDGS